MTNSLQHRKSTTTTTTEHGNGDGSQNNSSSSGTSPEAPSNGGGHSSANGNGKKSLRPRRRQSKNKNNNLVSISTITKLIVFTLLAIWLSVTMYFLSAKSHDPTQSTQEDAAALDRTSVHDIVSSVDPFQLQRQLHGPRFRSISNITYNAISSSSSSLDVVDMRQLSATLPFDNPDGGVWKQGWNVVPRTFTQKDDFEIIVVPHSHCDPGWIKTFDEYFKQQTNEIITTIIRALAKDRRRTFIWAEISYFSWWYQEASPKMRKAAQILLKRGQLEFVTGGWVQPDEANTELFAMEVQLQEGLDWIRTNLGKEHLPKYGWSIDPFGYSPTMPYLLKKYGYEAILIQRVHYAVKKELASKRQLEFIWRQTWDTEHKYDMFTHVMPFYSYDVPHTCGPDPSVCCQFDFARGLPQNLRGKRLGLCPWKKPAQFINERNVRERALLLLDQYLKKASLYRSEKVLFVPVGDDFRYQIPEEAEAQYVNYQKLFDYINQHVPGISIRFGTLSSYFSKVVNSFDKIPILKGSFFTYADRDEDYWSGYFTSRVFDKALDRKLERVLYAAEQLGATSSEMQSPRRALSLFQHHDGVTGTARENVVRDYAQRIHTAIHQVQDWIQQHIVPENQKSKVGACWQSDSPRGLTYNLCGTHHGSKPSTYLYNPLPTEQQCGDVVIPGNSTRLSHYPCDYDTKRIAAQHGHAVKFDPQTGLMTEPIQENWMRWKVQKGGAYLFFPHRLDKYKVDESKKEEKSEFGWTVRTENWSRQIVPVYLNDASAPGATVFDFIYEFNLQEPNEEWFVRFITSSIQNDGVFHTDLNGFNFDTHYFRHDMPIQSQVFPMPTLASIEDDKHRLTILSEHAQGTASLEAGSIDVWLDRRLKQDDSRGLAQGVQDTVPVRTRFRVVIETEGYQFSGRHNSVEFKITPFCQRMWDEVNHPLEAFGLLQYETSKIAQKKEGQLVGSLDIEPPIPLRGQIHPNLGMGLPDIRTQLRNAVIAKNPKKQYTAVSKKRIISTGKLPVTDATPIIPFVYMVHDRVDYMKKSIESIRQSDFDKSKIPLVVSIDGHVPEMLKYVTELEKEFTVHKIIHPYSCFDHPNEFPRDKEGKLNKGFKGDGYGNPRTGETTCCKHHFTWMIKTVFDGIPSLSKNNFFFFLEEDYMVAPNIYEALTTGVELMKMARPKVQDGIFGLALDPTDGHSREATSYDQDGFYLRNFVSGPMVWDRTMWNKFKPHGKTYCTFDEYNWDWSLVHLQALDALPSKVLVPTTPMVSHIGVEGGMHNVDPKQLSRLQRFQFPPEWHGYVLHEPLGYLAKAKNRKGFGGWAHPKDHEHCIKVLNA